MIHHGQIIKAGQIMATDKTHFRTSLSGFNKADVLEYLDGLNADFREETAKTAAALEEKTRQTEDLAAEAEKLRAALEEEKARAEKAAAESEALKAELEAAKQALAESEAVIASQTELIDELKKPAQAPDEGRDAEAERKAELYDGVSSQLGDILISANKSADEIIENANEKAKSINAEALMSAQSSRDAFAAAMEECTRIFTERAGAVSGVCCEDINSELQRTRDAVDRVLLQLQKSSLCIAEKTRQAKAQLDEQLKSSLDSLDSKITEIKNK